MEDIKPKTAETKPNVDGGACGDDENISLTVADQSGGAPVQFRIKKTTSFRKLMDAYCKKLGFDKQAIRFCFQGKRLLEQDTPKACGIEDGDDIDIYYRQPFGYGGPSVSMRSSCCLLGPYKAVGATSAFSVCSGCSCSQTGIPLAMSRHSCESLSYETDN